MNVSPRIWKIRYSVPNGFFKSADVIWFWDKKNLRIQKNCYLSARSESKKNHEPVQDMRLWVSDPSSFICLYFSEEKKWKEIFWRDLDPSVDNKLKPIRRQIEVQKKNIFTRGKKIKKTLKYLIALTDTK